MAEVIENPYLHLLGKKVKWQSMERAKKGRKNVVIPVEKTGVVESFFHSSVLKVWQAKVDMPPLKMFASMKISAMVNCDQLTVVE